ncbi:hypothetical protein [Francisella orientalis]|uniref:hypothetical protein n=1 Tax=Francisella orientalis TaxID=299583 RepID=UPI001E4C2137|nr:hypothetical protein [Francisella orientalis]
MTLSIIVLSLASILISDLSIFIDKVADALYLYFAVFSTNVPLSETYKELPLTVTFNVDN